MKIFTDVAQLNESVNNKLVATIGNFDGVHLGHQYLIKDIQNRKKIDEKIVLITFRPHPEFIIRNVTNYLLTTYEVKYKYLEKLGMDYVLEIDFTQELRNLDPTIFFNTYILSIKNLTTFYLGEDFSLGKNKCFCIEDGLKLLSEKNIAGERLRKINIEGEIVSSSLIRSLIEGSNFKKVKELLGRPYSFSSTVINGKKIGRTIDFKTANLQTDFQILYPNPGVYAAKIKIDKETFSCAMNIGFNPTISVSDDVKIELHILDFDKEIYGREVSVIPIEKIREEMKFLDLEELKNQIKKDVNQVRTIVNDSTSVDW